MSGIILKFDDVFRRTEASKDIMPKNLCRISLSISLQSRICRMIIRFNGL